MIKPNLQGEQCQNGKVRGFTGYDGYELSGMCKHCKIWVYSGKQMIGIEFSSSCQSCFIQACCCPTLEWSSHLATHPHEGIQIAGLANSSRALLGLVLMHVLAGGNHRLLSIVVIKIQAAQHILGGHFLQQRRKWWFLHNLISVLPAQS